MIDNNPSSNNTNKTDVNTGRPLLKKDKGEVSKLITVSTRPSSGRDWIYDLYCRGLEKNKEWGNIND